MQCVSFSWKHVSDDTRDIFDLCNYGLFRDRPALESVRGCEANPHKNVSEMFNLKCFIMQKCVGEQENVVENTGNWSAR